MKYKIEKLLDGVGEGKIELAKKLDIFQGSINNVFNLKKATLNTQKRYTKAYNSIFNTKFTKEELFELNEVEN